MKNKKIVKTLLSLSLLFLISINVYAASKNKAQAPAVDSEYSEESSSNNIKTSNPDLQKIADRNSSSYISRSFKDMFTLGSKAVYYEYDTASFYLKNLAGSLKNQKATVVFNPDTKYAGWGSVYFAAYYYFLMDEDSRATLKKCMETYLSDFENKRLNRKEKSTWKKYERADVMIEWGTFKSSTNFFAHGKAYLGYEFVKKSPYFTVTFLARPNENLHPSRNVSEEKCDSMNLKYHFTRAQIAIILNALSEENISSIIEEYKSYFSYSSPDTYDSDTSNEDSYIEEN